MAQHRVDLGQRPDFLQDHFLLADHIFFQMRFLEVVQAAHEFGQSVGVLLVKLGVEQLERIRQFLQALDGVAQLVQVRDLQFELRGGRQEFVHRRIEQAHRDGQSLHRLEDALEVGALYRQQAIQRGLALFLRFGQDHFLHDGQAVGAVEHAFGAAQADTHRAEFACAGRIAGCVGIRHHLEPDISSAQASSVANSSENSASTVGTSPA